MSLSSIYPKLIIIISFFVVSNYINAQNPIVSDIPNQTINEGEVFTTITLDAYVSDETADADIVWTYSGNTDLTVSISADRVVTITYPEGWTGSETITFMAEDSDGLTSSVDVVFTVNSAPSISSISNQTINEGEAFTTITLDTYVSDETADADIVWTYSGNTDLIVSISADRVVTITYPEGWTGSETITFMAEDSDGLTSSVDVVFTVNSAPSISSISNQTINEGEAFTTITLDTYVSDETADADIVWTYSGNTDLTVSISADRVVTITYPEGWTGSETITFMAEDSDGLTSSVDVVFTVNSAPSISSISNQTINEGEAFTTITLDTYVSDETADADIVWTYSGNTDLIVSISADRVVTITYPEGWTGSETITFMAEDSDGLTSSVDVVFTVNSAPSISSISNQTINEGEAFTTITLDTYVSDETADADIVWTYSGNTDLTVSISADRVVTITYPEGWTGSETITFMAEDSDGLTSSVDVVFTVNSAPSISSISNQTINEGEVFTTITLDTYVSDETADADIVWTYSGNTDLTVSISADRVVTITYPEGWTGSETITFMAEDSDGLTSSVDVVFTVNSAPSISSISNQTINEGEVFTTITLDTYVSDETADADIVWTYSGNTDLTVSISADRVVTITYPEGWTGSETITFMAEDSDGLTSGVDVVFTVNSAPSISSISNQTINEGEVFTTITLDTYVSDETADADIVWTYSGNTDLTVSISADRVVTITYPEGWTGSETITFMAEDSDGLTSSVDVVFTVNSAPSISSISNQTINEGEVFTTITLDTYVSDETADADIVWTYSGNTDLTVSISADRVVTITYPEGWTGSETITFMAEDSDGLTSSVDVVFTVNSAPSISSISNQTINEGEVFTTITLDTYVSDETADADIVWTYSGNTDLTVSISADRVVTITYPEGWTGSETITFMAEDSDGLTSSVDVVFTVNSAPSISSISNQTINEGEAFITITLDTYVSDETADADIVWTYSGNTDLIVSISADRVVTITYPEGWTGSETITFMAEDSDGLTSSVDVVFTVNSAPSISSISNQTINEGEAFTTITLDTYVSDETADADIVWTYSGNTDLIVSISADRVVTITYPEGWTGSETITFMAEDSDGLTSSVDVVFTVNSAPSISSISNQTINEGEAFTTITLDTYVSDETADADIVWTYSGNTDLTVSISADRVVTITYPEGWTGSETITFMAEDSDGLTSSVDVVFTVNSAPSISSISNQTINEGEAFTTITLDTYVSDETADADIVWTYSGNTDLIVSISADRVVTITYPEGWTGSETITFMAEDSDGLTSSVDVVFTVNSAPSISSISNQTINEGEAFTTITLDTYVSDETADADIVWTYSGNTDLTVSISADRIANISIPDVDWYGLETIGFHATDERGLTTIANATYTVTPVNDIPVIDDIPDQIRAEDVSFSTINLDAYIDDVETSDENISWSLNSVPTYFDVVIDNREASITPKDVEWNGVEVITFVATDESNASVYDNVRLEVTEVNDAPVITGQNSISIAEETLTTLNLSDIIVTDPDDNYPTGFSLIVLSGTNYEVNGTAITPNENVTGIVTVPVYVIDPSGAESNTYSLEVNVINDNDPPVVIDIPNQIIDEGDSFTNINLNTYVSDPDNNVDDISWTYSGNSDLSLSINETTKIASIEIPDENWNGSETIRFTANDGSLSAYNDVVLTVLPINDAPVINSQQTLSFNEDVVFTIPFTALNVTDIDNTYSSQHEMTLLPGSNYTFTGRQVTPTQDFNGILTIPLYISDLGPENEDSEPFNLSVIINPVNDAPVIESQVSTLTTNEDISFEISIDDLNVSDVDNDLNDLSIAIHSGDNYTYSGTTVIPDLNYYGSLSVNVSVNDGGSVNSESNTIGLNAIVLSQNDYPVANNQTIATPEDQSVVVDMNSLVSDVDGNLELSTLKIITDSENGTTNVNSDLGEITYYPNTSYSGYDSFTYEICDSEGACSSGVISLTVSNEAPTGNDDAAEVDEDNSILIDVVDNDTDPQNNIDENTLSLLSVPENGSASVQTGGIINYIPNQDFFGTDEFDYQVCDEDGYCTIATASVTVNSVNDQPVIASQNTINIIEEESYTITLNDIDVSDVDNNYPSDFILDVLAGANYTVVGNTITPTLNYSGELLVNVSVDDQELINNISNPYAFVINVEEVNDRPEITDQQSLLTNEDESLLIQLTDLIVNDPDNNYPNDFVLVVLAGLNYTVDNNVITPVSNYFGYLNIPVYVSDQSDENDRSRTFNLVVQVNSQNDAPVTQNVNYSTSENVSIEINFEDLVTDVDGNIDYSTFENISSPSSGIIQIDGTNFIVTYSPNQGFSGDDEFNFMFYDSEGLESNISTIYVNINNEAPNAINDNVEVNEDESIVISVLENDTDPQDNIDISSLIIINNPVNGELSLNSSSAEVTYTPNENYFGTDNFRYRVFDDLGYSDDATVSISILEVNDLPIAINDESETNEDESVIIDVLTNDYDIDSESDGFVVTITLQPENGIAEVNASNQIIYTPLADFNGSDNFEYQVCDSENACDNASVNVAVYPQNDAPVAYDDEINTSQDSEVTINVISNDIDIDENLDITSVIITSGPLHGTYDIESITGEITYWPSEGYSGSDSFVYQICDSDGECANATVTITVNLANEAPTCENDIVTMVDGATVTFSVLDNDSDINNDNITVVIGETSQLRGDIRSEGNGQYTYTSKYGAYCIEEYFTYQGCDGSGNCDDATVKFIIEVSDTDEDGIADYIEEQNFNTDGDEYPDYRDTDSDNDGILDAIEGDVSDICLQDVKDTDGDGIPDYRDDDSDDDGILDIEEGADDCDNDGLLNFQDDFDDCADRIEAPDTFSPNGDGVNDYFLIPGVSDYEGNEIFIYNRWGGEVFHMKNYDNKWDGKSSNSAIGSDELPQGLYFYILKLGGSKGVIKGSVYIKR